MLTEHTQFTYLDSVHCPLTVLFKVGTGHLLQSNTSLYNVEEFIGEGSFGKVARCKNLVTQELVAVKIIKATVKHKEKKEVCFWTPF